MVPIRLASILCALSMATACQPEPDGQSEGGTADGDVQEGGDPEAGSDGEEDDEGDDDSGGTGTESCEIIDLNHWVLDVMGDHYLWNAELPEVDPAEFETPTALIQALRYELDRWSRISDKTTSDNLFMEGKIISFGWRTKRDADDGLRLASVYADSPAFLAGLRRGDKFISLNGMTVEEIDEADGWSEVWGPSEPGVELSAVLQSPEGEDKTVEIIKDWVTIVTVSAASAFMLGDRTVGYLVLETFVEPAHDALRSAFIGFQAAGVDTLILDLRYNGGGLLSVTRTFANLVGGLSAEGEVMYTVEYNADNVDKNTVHEFVAQAESIGVQDVVFITTGRTLSASELLINSLRPHFNVGVIGTASGGKPFGSNRFESCEKVLFPLTFRLVNADGFTDYFDGLEPDCIAEDELVRQLGDPAEASMAEALTWLETGQCSTTEGLSPVGREDTLPVIRGDGLDELLGGAW